MTAREAALKIVYNVFENKAYTNIAIDRELSKNEIEDRRDINLVTEIVNGTIKYKLKIDYVISQFSTKKIEKLSPWVRNILRISIYQIFYLDKIPESAAVNEGVNLTKKYSNPGSVKFVNGMLRNIIRKREEITYPDDKTDGVNYLSIEYSFPVWLVKKFINDYGFSNTKKLLKYFNETPKFWIRVNTNRITVEEFTKILDEKAIEYEQSEYVGEAFLIKEKNNLLKEEEFKAGYFSVQDETSMFAVDVLDPRKDEIIIDACSAPGGKASFIAERMAGTGLVHAYDIHPHRVKTIRDLKERLGLENINEDVLDARELSKKHQEKVDKILLDVPCSGLGVLGKRSDSRYNKSQEDIAEIIKIQEDILEEASKLVKPDGVIVYSTCTINRDENQDIIDKFLSKHEEFRREEMSKYHKFQTKEKDIQILPFKDDREGFYIAKLRRSGE